MLPDFITERLALKKRVGRYRALMGNGIWQVNGRYLTRRTAAADAINRIFEDYVERRPATASGARQWLKRLISALLGLNRMMVFGRGKFARADTVYVTREKQIKFFDFGRGAVLTTTDDAAWAKYAEIRKLDLTRYFHTPEARLVMSPAGPVRQEVLLSAPPIGQLPSADQLAAVAKIHDRYAAYIAAHRERPRPEVMMQSYHEVAALLPADIRARYLACSDQVERLSRRYGFIPSHLDFNIANLIDAGEIWLIDLDDAGLSLPCLYDLNNLALNEVYEGRPTTILDNLLTGVLAGKFRQSLNVAIEDTAPGDDRLSLLVNYFMRESTRVTQRLFKTGPNATRALRHWRLFEAGIPWWGKRWAG